MPAARARGLGEPLVVELHRLAPVGAGEVHEQRLGAVALERLGETERCCRSIWTSSARRAGPCRRASTAARAAGHARPASARPRSRDGGRSGRCRRRGSRSPARAAPRPSPSTRCASPADRAPRASPSGCPRPPYDLSRARNPADRACAGRPRSPLPGPFGRRRGATTHRIPGRNEPRSRRLRLPHTHVRAPPTARSTPRSPGSSRSPRLVIGPAEAQRVGVGDVGGGHLARQLVTVDPRRPRGGIDLVVDVRDVVRRSRLRTPRRRGTASAARTRRTAGRCRRARVRRRWGRRRRSGHAAVRPARAPAAVRSTCRAGRSCARLKATLASRAVARAGCARINRFSAMSSAPRPRRSASSPRSGTAFRTLPDRYLGADPRLRRHLSDQARRSRPHLGGALHHARRAGPQGRDPPAPRRDDRHRLGHLAARCARASCRGSTRSSSAG